MISFTKGKWISRMKGWLFSLGIFALILFFTSCRDKREVSEIGLSAYAKEFSGSFIVPINGMLRLYSHHETEPFVLGVNHSTNEVFVFDYENHELKGLNLLDKHPDWNPGILYSMGFYKDAYYVLGSSGLFLFNYDGLPIKSWKQRMGLYSEIGVVPSFIVSEDGHDYLVARITSFKPPEHMDKPFHEQLNYFRVLSRIKLDMQSEDFDLSYFVGYPPESPIGKKLPATLTKFTAFDNKVNVLFSSDPTIWQYERFDHDNTSYRAIPITLNDAKNNYYLSDNEQVNSMRLFSENPSFDIFLLDRANGDHYLQYRPPFDEEHWPKMRRLGDEWVKTEIGLAGKVRTAKFDKDFNRIYEIDNKASPGIGRFQLVHDGNFFVFGQKEPEIGTEFEMYRLHALPKKRD